MKGKQTKFRAGQVVMVRNAFGSYPVKLDHHAKVQSVDGIAWFDSLHNVEYESEMRRQNAREIGYRPARKPKKTLQTK